MMITRNAFYKIIDIVGVWGGWGPTITVAWGLIWPKFGPARVTSCGTAYSALLVWCHIAQPTLLYLCDVMWYSLRCVTCVTSCSTAYAVLLAWRHVVQPTLHYLSDVMWYSLRCITCLTSCGTAYAVLLVWRHVVQPTLCYLSDATWYSLRCVNCLT